MNVFSKLVHIPFTWDVIPDTGTEFQNAHVIIGLSFGIGPDNTAGKSNVALAKVAQSLSSKFALPSILQWEIASCISGFDREVTISKHQDPEKYLDTYEVLRQAYAICKKNVPTRGGITAIIVAHPDHVWRVEMTAKKFGFKTLIPNTYDVPYDQHSTQEWTRSFKKFIFREIAARIIYLLKGWI